MASEIRTPEVSFILGSNHFKQVLIVIAAADYNLFFF